jgi:hypothetical protein
VNVAAGFERSLKTNYVLLLGRKRQPKYKCHKVVSVEVEINLVISFGDREINEDAP